MGGATVDLSGRSHKKQLESAQKSDARVAVVVDAGHPGTIQWHDLKHKTERAVDESDLAEFARRAVQGEPG
jgi:histidyl-tRNA synthetase